MERDRPAPDEEAPRRRDAVRRRGAWESESARTPSQVRALLRGGSGIPRVRRLVRRRVAARSSDRREQKHGDATRALLRIVSRARRRPVADRLALSRTATARG